MAGGRGRVATALGGLAAVAVLLAAAPGARPAPPVAPAPPAVTMRVLQMNLCGSGLAGCYTGRAIAQATDVIRATAPDLVTLNEVCRGDVARLALAMGAVPAFQPARDRATGGPYRCRDGQPYGIGLLARPAGGYAVASGIYPVQLAGVVEERAWLCLDEGRFAACTTHLVNDDQPVAAAQCRYLLDTLVPAVRAREGSAPVVLGADLNLWAGSPGLRSCVPAGFRRADDGGVQHVLATPEFTVTALRTVGMRGTTDHPGLLVTLTLTRSAGTQAPGAPLAPAERALLIMDAAVPPPFRDFPAAASTRP